MLEAPPLTKLGWVLTVVSFAIVPSAAVVFTWYRLICWRTGVREPFDSGAGAPFWLSGVTTGVLERIFFSVAVALNASGVVVGMMAWIGLKAAIHWQAHMTTAEGEARTKAVKESYVALLGSLSSMFLALLVGFYASGTPWVWC